MLEPLLRAIAAQANVPFLPRVSREPLLQLLQQIPQISVRSDPFAVSARLHRGRPTRRVVIMTHLDHPGLVLRDAHHGIPFGSVGYERIAAHLARAPIPIRIYHPDGSRPQPGLVTAFQLRANRPVVTISAPSAVAVNSPAVWDVPEFTQQDDLIHMVNADNGAVTAVALRLLQTVADRDLDLDLEVVFTLLEEVHQLASTAIALRGSTPFGPIDARTLLINLEAPEMKVAPAEQAFLAPLGLSAPNYDSGVLLRVSEGLLRYGVHFPQTVNQLELLVLAAADQLGIPLQYTLSSGSSDAKSFALFARTPHLVTLAVPCRWKHNHGPDGEFIPEEVRRRDLEHLLALLTTLLTLPPADPPAIQPLSRRLADLRFGMSADEAARLRRQRVTMLRAALPRLRRGVYFPETIVDRLQFNFARLCARLRAALPER